MFTVMACSLCVYACMRINPGQRVFSTQSFVNLFKVEQRLGRRGIIVEYQRLSESDKKGLRGEIGRNDIIEGPCDSSGVSVICSTCEEDLRMVQIPESDEHNRVLTRKNVTK